MRTARDRGLDVFKGLLVILMTWCHVIQFFGAPDVFPIERDIELVINLLVFPGFVFAFGAAAALSFYSKPFSAAGPRLLLSLLKSLGAFYISGIAFRVMREGKPFAAGTVRRILLLQDLPGWSEFLASFAALALMALVFYWPLKRLKDRPLWLLPIALACLALCYLPYGSIEHPLLRLFFGTTAYAAFPPFQYFPYFLAGLAYVRLRQRGWWWLALIALLSTGAGLLRAQTLGHSPVRFPPDWGWIVLPAAGLALLMALSEGLSALGRGLGRWQEKLPGLVRRGERASVKRADPAGEHADLPDETYQAKPSPIQPLPMFSRRFRGLDPLRPLSHLGHNSLYYLLAGNLILFSLSGRNVKPVLQFRASGLFGQPVAAPAGALWWTLALLLAACFVASLIRRGRKQTPPPSPD